MELLGLLEHLGLPRLLRESDALDGRRSLADKCREKSSLVGSEVARRVGRLHSEHPDYHAGGL